MIYVEWLDGHMHTVAPGSLLTRRPLEQWIGWLSEAGRRQPGFRDLLRKASRDLEWAIYGIEKMIDASPTFKTWDGEVCKVISEYEEEDFVETLEGLRDLLNAVIGRMSVRRPLKRRIELLMAVTPEANASPGEVANAKAAVERLQQRLEGSQ